MDARRRYVIATTVLGLLPLLWEASAVSRPR